MRHNYIIPKTIPPERLGPGERSMQNKYLTDGYRTGPVATDMSVQLSESLLQTGSMQGIGIRHVFVYNFTDRPISMIDSSNSVVVLDPMLRSSIYDNLGDGHILVEITYANPNQSLTSDSINYLDRRCDALSGVDLPGPSANLYKVDNIHDYPATKACQNQRHRYVLTSPTQLFDDMGGSFYIEEADIVIDGMRGRDVVIHPKSSKSVLRKVRPNLGEADALTVDIAINDPHHYYDKAFINIGGAVVEIPVDRDPSLSPGVTYVNNTMGPGAATRYSLGSKECPIKIFSSSSEAYSAGSPDKAIELDLVKSKLKLQEEKIAQEREKADHERAEFERSIKRAEEAAKAAKEKADRDRAEQARAEEARRRATKENERIENISFIRKVLVEGAKAVAAIAATAALIIGWYSKNKA